MSLLCSTLHQRRALRLSNPVVCILIPPSGLVYETFVGWVDDLQAVRHENLLFHHPALCLIYLSGWVTCSWS